MVSSSRELFFSSSCNWAEVSSASYWNGKSGVQMFVLGLHRQKSEADLHQQTSWWNKAVEWDDVSCQLRGDTNWWLLFGSFARKQTSPGFCGEDVRRHRCSGSAALLGGEGWLRGVSFHWHWVWIYHMSPRSVGLKRGSDCTNMWTVHTLTLPAGSCSSQVDVKGWNVDTKYSASNTLAIRRPVDGRKN